MASPWKGRRGNTSDCQIPFGIRTPVIPGEGRSKGIVANHPFRTGDSNAGTAHGRLLLAKLAVLVPILGLAIVNRTRILPALSGSGGRPPMHRLAAFVGGEAVLALVLLALADDLGEHYDSGKT